MIPEGEQARIGDGGTKSGLGVEMEPQTTPRVNKCLRITLTVTIVLLSVLLFAAAIAVDKEIDTISGFQQKLNQTQDAIDRLQWHQADLERKQKDAQDAINLPQWGQDDSERRQKIAQDAINTLQWRLDDLERKLKDDELSAPLR
jgi:hypothetical protein